MSEQVGQFFLHSERNPILHQRSDQSFGFLISPEKQRCIFNIIPFFHPVPQQACHIFVSGISKFFYLHRLSRFIWCGKFFCITVFIVIDHLHSCIQDISTAPVIDIQDHRLRIFKIFRKIQHDLRASATEMIDRLIIVSHHKQIVLRCCQHLHDIILKMIDILKLIHQNIVKLFLPCRQDIFSFFQKFITAQQHIIKVKFSSFIQDFSISLKDLSEHFIRAAGRIIMLQSDPSTLYNTDLLGNIFHKIPFLGLFCSTVYHQFS